MAEPSDMVKVTGCFTHNGSKNRASRSMNTPCRFEYMQTVAEIEARVRSKIRFSLVKVTK